MKSKIKRHSRSVLSVVLALSMLVSCMTVGIIATDAAKVTDSSEAVAAKEFDGNDAVAAKSENFESVGSGDQKPDIFYANLNGAGWKEYSTTENSNDYTNYTRELYIKNGDPFLLKCTGNSSYYWHEGGTAMTTDGVRMNDASNYTGNASSAYDDGVYTVNIKWGDTGNSYGSPWVWFNSASAPDRYVRLSSNNNFAATQMSFSAGVYSTTYSGITAGTQQYKLTTTSSGWDFAPHADDISKISLTIDGASSTVSTDNYGNITFTTLVASDITFTYNMNSGATNIAVTSSAPHTVTFGVHSSGNGTISNNRSISSGDSISGSITFTASPSTGYEVAGWYSDSACTTAIAGAGTSTTYTATISSDITVYVKFVRATWIKTVSTLPDVAPGSYVDASNNYLLLDTNSDFSGTRYNVTLKQGTGNSFYWAELTSSNTGLWSNQNYVMWSSTTSTSGAQGNSGTRTKINGTSTTDAVEFKDSSNNYLFKVQNTSQDDKRALMIYKVSDKVRKIGVRVSNSSGTLNYEFYYQLAEETPVDPTTEITNVDIYAKDGSLRDGYQKFSEYIVTNITNIQNADGTTNTAKNGEVKRYNYQNTSTNTTTQGFDNTGSTRYDYAKVTDVPVGSTITVTARVYAQSQQGDDWYGRNFNATHYVKGFCINGYTPELYTWHAAESGNAYTDYTMTYTILEEDVAIDRNNRGYIEITPIVYLNDATYTKTFYIEGYDRTAEKYKNLGWGTTLAVYPYYDGIKEDANAFGGYPGQPMLFYKGRYEIQVPLTRDGTSNDAKCLGITLSNNYWDELHRSLDKDIVNNDTGHRQTYDFDDFYKIKEEKNPDQIIFSFKLREQQAAGRNNYSDGYTRDTFTYANNYQTLYRNTTTNKLYTDQGTTLFSENGVDEYKDALGRDVNLFGTVLTSAQATNAKLLVVSNGYKYTYVGKYATEWVVYSQGATANGYTQYNYVTQIAPSALVLNSADSFEAYTGGTSTTAATSPKPLGNYLAAYNMLNATPYNDRGFEICYENSQYIGSDDKADRLDGRWLYSKNGDKISANIKIQYKDTANGAWTDETTYSTGYDNKENKGDHTYALAYFTNVTPKDVDGLMTASDIPIVPGNYFTFKTVAPTDAEHMNYVFKGWYVSLNGSDPVAIDSVPQLESHLEMTGNAVIIARYEKLTSGILTIGHTVGTGTVSGTTYSGSGTAYLKVELLNSAGTVIDNTFAETATGQYQTTKYMTYAYAANGYKFRITLRTVDANEDNTYGTTTETGSLGSLSGTSPTEASGTINSAAGKTITIPISAFFSGETQSISSLQYVSYFNLTEYTYRYVINYKFPTRLYGDQVYTVSSTDITGNKASAYFDGTKSSAKLKSSIISGNTPYETNFMKTITWDYDSAYTKTLESATDYTQGGQFVSNSGNTYTVNVTVIATQTENRTIHAIFMLPYAYDSTTKQAKEYDVYDGVNTYDTTKDKSGYELYTTDESGAYTTTKEYAGYTDEALIATGKYLMYDESAGDSSPRKTYDNLTATSVAGKTTQNGEDKIVGYDNSLAGVPITAESGELLTYDGHVNGKASHFITAPEYIYVKNANTNEKDNWNHKKYGNVSYHTYRETTTFRTYDVTTNASYVSYNNIKDGIVASNDYTKVYFTRWDVYSQDDNRFITSCYYYDFNYTCYEDVYIVPVFESTARGGFIGDSAGTKTSVSYLADSRNQWNTKIGDDEGTPNSADKLYTDFALSFHNDDTILKNLTSDSDKKVRVGLLIERVGLLTGESTSSTDPATGTVITDPGSYMTTFNPANYESMLRNDSAAAASYKKSGNSFLAGTAVNCKIASNDTTWTGCSRALTSLDNKNGVEYYYGINKMLEGTSYNTYKYAYRAVSYIMVKDGEGDWQVEVSDVPAYFTIYDTATQTVAAQ